METLQYSVLIIIFNNENWNESALQKQLFSVFMGKLTRIGIMMIKIINGP